MTLTIRLVGLAGCAAGANGREVVVGSEAGAVVVGAVRDGIEGLGEAASYFLSM